jgi:hypothetical protein
MLDMSIAPGSTHVKRLGKRRACSTLVRQLLQKLHLSGVIHRMAGDAEDEIHALGSVASGRRPHGIDESPLLSLDGLEDGRPLDV